MPDPSSFRSLRTHLVGPNRWFWATVLIMALFILGSLIYPYLHVEFNRTKI